MANILNLLELDICTVKSTYRMVILIYLVSAVLGILEQPMLTIGLVMVLCVFFSGLPFSIIEKNQKIYGILPIRRIEIVISRYLYAFVLGIKNILIAVIIALIIIRTQEMEIEMFAFLSYISLSFLYYSFTVAVSYPVYFKFGFSKSYIFTSLPMYILFAILAYISIKTDFLKNINQIILYFATRHILILLYGFFLGISLLLVSVEI
jgi:hypothetical protein